MNVTDIILAVFLGVAVLMMNFTFSCGVVYFWHERKRILSVLFALVSMAITMAYACAVINRVCV